MYMIGYGRFKELKAKVFVDWFLNEENVNKLKATIPEGAKFMGAFLVTSGHADHDYEIWYEIENYAVLDNWSNENPKIKAFGEEIARTLGVLFKWGRTRFLKPVTDVTLIDPELFKKG
ncbi:MAG: hypothetical protein ACXAB7_21590 [Candidatus Kariarchaeaceae archaeon]